MNNILFWAGDKGRSESLEKVDIMYACVQRKNSFEMFICLAKYRALSGHSWISR